MKFISGFHRELGIADEEAEFLNRIRDKGRLLSYLSCLLSGITFDEIKEMEAHNLSEDGIRSMRCQILSGVYRDQDRIEKGLEETKARLEQTVSDFKTVTDRYQKMAEDAWEKERAAFEETIRVKDALIEKTRAYADELQEKVLAMKKEAEKADAAAYPESEKRRGLFGLWRHREDERERKIAEDRRHQKEFEEEQFRDYILRNPKFSEEQKKLLLSRFLKGDSFWSIVRYAHPELSVEFMKALLEGDSSGL